LLIANIIDRIDKNIANLSISVAYVQIYTKMSRESLKIQHSAISPYCDKEALAERLY
jgi:hypothetical protein